MRFLGNINQTQWDNNIYSKEIKVAVNLSKVVIIELINELLPSQDDYYKIIRRTVLENDYDKIFAIYKSGIGNYEKLQDILFLPQLHEDPLWTDQN